MDDWPPGGVEERDPVDDCPPAGGVEYPAGGLPLVDEEAVPEVVEAESGTMLLLLLFAVLTDDDVRNWPPGGPEVELPGPPGVEDWRAVGELLWPPAGGKYGGGTKG